MSKPLTIWQFLLNKLNQAIPAMLLYVVESKGSSPGRQGFFMVVSIDGEMCGSIGGGVMEHKFVELAKERLQDQSKEGMLRKQIHDKEAAKNQSGMICSGEQSIFLYSVQQKDQSTIETIIATLQENKNGLLQLDPNGLAFQKEAAGASDFYYQFNNEDDWLYQENLGYKNQLYIIGGGHCSLALSKLMSQMDFYIHLFEDRIALNTFDENNFVHQKHLVTNYSELEQLVQGGKNVYVVIMSFGYRSDDLAVRALLQKDFAYLGLLGSAAKIDKMFAAYRAEGISQQLLDKIHAPIGLPINSQTPEEIAISIAAQIIEVKNKNLSSKNVSSVSRLQSK